MGVVVPVFKLSYAFVGYNQFRDGGVLVYGTGFYIPCYVEEAFEKLAINAPMGENDYRLVGRGGDLFNQ